MEPQDEAEFRAFVQGRSGALLHTARLLSGHDEAAEDLLQEALARLVPQWHRVQSPEAYVRTTMHRLQIGRWRRRGVLREDATAVVPEQEHADHSAAVHERLVLLRALDRLTPRQRSVLVCRYIEDLDERETARRLGVRVGTVRSICHRALARMRAVSPELADLRPTTAVTASPDVVPAASEVHP